MSMLARTALGITAPRMLRDLRRTCDAPREVQARLLAHIVRKNADTVYGRRYGFARVDSVESYQRLVPISTYERFEPYVSASMRGEPGQLTKETPLFYAETSGTTGNPKYLPVTAEKRAATAKRMRLWASVVCRDHPKAFRGRIMTLVSPEVRGFAPCGKAVGAESGHTYRTIPRLVKSLYSAPDEVFSLPDFEGKYYSILRFAAGQPVSFICMVNPSTIVLLAERLAEYGEAIIRDVRDGTLSSNFDVPDSFRQQASRLLRPDATRARFLELAARRAGGVLLPKYVWPDLGALGCWKGGSAGMYLEKFDHYFPKGIPVRDLGYLSSEHQGSTPLSDDGDAGVLAIDGNFFEFRPVNEGEASADDLLTPDQLELGKRYFVFVTTMGGLYRYDMNDIVEVAGFFGRTPMIRFVQKGVGIASFTGEKLYECQVISAVKSAFNDLASAYRFIAAVGQFRGGRPRYSFMVEFDDIPAGERVQQYIERIDRAIRSQNSEYDSKRSSGRLDPPVVSMIRLGEFDRYRRRMVEKGRQDGQFKIVHLTTDEAFQDEFETVANPPTRYPESDDDNEARA